MAIAEHIEWDAFIERHAIPKYPSPPSQRKLRRYDLYRLGYKDHVPKFLRYWDGSYRFGSQKIKTGASSRSILNGGPHE